LFLIYQLIKKVSIKWKN